MTHLTYIEDLFVRVIDIMDQNLLGMQYHDQSAARSFYNSITQGKDLTEKQGAYVLKIIHKYRNSVKPYIDVEPHLEHPLWKKPFRVVDRTKKIWVEQEITKTPLICLKFPYDLKDDFESKFRPHREDGHFWNVERRIRQINLYKANIIQIQEWVEENDFELDDTFISCVDQVEEIWQERNRYEPYSIIKDDEVSLVNCSEEVEEFFIKNSNSNIVNDLFLAKSMNFPLKNPNNTIAQRISSNRNNTFWVKNVDDFIKLGYEVNGKVVLLLDRTSDALEYMQQLSKVIDCNNFDRNDFRVCFRTNNKENPEFNDWVRDNKFGGKIEGAKFLIFQHKPAKWLFKQENDVIIIATNNLMPSTYGLTRDLLEHHPLVFYVGDIEPSKGRKEIVEL
jgi:hypothetical protein